MPNRRNEIMRDREHKNSDVELRSFDEKEKTYTDDPCNYCLVCSGSGEGQYDGSVCPACKGSGEAINI